MKKTRLHSDSNCLTIGDNLSFGPLTLINLFGTDLVLADCSAQSVKVMPLEIQFYYVIILPVLVENAGYLLFPD